MPTFRKSFAHGFLLGVLTIVPVAASGAEPTTAPNKSVNKPRLRAAALEFAITPTTGGSTSGKTHAVVQQVAGPLKSTVTLLEDGDLRLCLMTLHFNTPKAVNVSALLRRTIADDLKLPLAQVLLFVSHNHT